MERCAKLQSVVLLVHHRNGGSLPSIDLSLPLMHPVFQIDSLDLAEIVAAIEKEFGIYPFESANPPKTWGDICDRIEAAAEQKRAA
jgi:acyl carrier protein